IRRRHPGHELFVILGSDCLPDLPGWRDPTGIVTQAGLLAVARPGFPVWPARQLADALSMPPSVELNMQTVPIPLIEIASRDLRLRVTQGRSIRYLVPRAVQCYIEQHQLYRS